MGKFTQSDCPIHSKVEDRGIFREDPRATKKYHYQGKKDLHNFYLSQHKHFRWLNGHEIIWFYTKPKAVSAVIIISQVMITLILVRIDNIMRTNKQNLIISDLQFVWPSILKQWWYLKQKKFRRFKNSLNFCSCFSKSVFC